MYYVIRPTPRMWLFLLCLFFSLNPIAHAAPSERTLSGPTDARILALEAVADVLMYQNPGFHNNDPALQQGYHQTMDSLQTWAQGQGLSATVLNPIADMKQAMTDVDREAKDKSRQQMLPMWINRVVQAHARLDQALAKLSGRPGTWPADELDALSLALAMQNLAYQTATFSSINLLILDGDPQLMNILDQHISTAIDSLEGKDRGAATATGKLAICYRFIRPRIVGHQEHWVPNLVAFNYQRMSKLVAEVR